MKWRILECMNARWGDYHHADNDKPDAGGRNNASESNDYTDKTAENRDNHTNNTDCTDSNNKDQMLKLTIAWTKTVLPYREMCHCDILGTPRSTQITKMTIMLIKLTASWSFLWSRWLTKFIDLSLCAVPFPPTAIPYNKCNNNNNNNNICVIISATATAIVIKL